ncbi:hypothetical protein [Glycomyces terrestris]|uniref:Tetratricopeptide repeat protein n=1 Tax=Glycomyces terrestris TaxID=2493553 RepID=A0A426UWE2_9ACTN|nr:hypothetical protein [Glycomyces terrestris]RRR98655.1 hypothetical protein EIW28_17490 [Glycomyces terrestris]
MLAKLVLSQARAARDRGDHALAARDLDTAEREYAAAIRKSEKKTGDDPAFDDTNAAARIGQGRVQLARAQPQAADLRFSEVQQRWPDRWAGFYWSGCAAAHGGSYARAEWFFSAAIARGAPGAHLQRAYTRVKLGQDARALEDLGEAAGRGPLDLPALELGALLALRTGQAPQAEWFAQAAATPLADAVRGVLAHRRGDTAAALAATGRALDAGLDDPVARLLHGASAYRTGDLDAAVASWTRVPGRGDLEARARYARALRRRDAGDFDGAAADFEAAAPYGYDAPVGELRLHAAAAAVAAADLDEARRHLYASAHPRARRFRGLLAFAAGDTDTAAAALEHPDDPLGRLGLALVLLARGERPETELKELCEPPAPQAVRRGASRALAALRAGDGDWDGACDAFEADPAPGPAPDDETYGEALYRAGRLDALAALTANPWRAPALLRTGADAEPGTGRAGAEAARVLREAAYTAAADGDWELAAARNRKAATVLGTADALLDALIAAFGGDRAAAAAAVPGTDPARPLLLLHGLADTRDPDLAGPCIAAWAPLLADDDHWERRRADAARRYAAPVTTAAMDDARDRLRRLIEKAAADAGAADAPALLHRETAAADALAALGGLPPGDAAEPADPLVCGPLRLAELGLHDRFGAFTAGLDPLDRGVIEIHFSAAGTAAAALALGRPGEALRAALDLRCPDCRGADPTGSEPHACDPDCARFAARNPAYAGRPEGRASLREHAAAFACEALLALAAAAVGRKDGGAETAAGHWREAARLARLAGEADGVAAATAATALGRGEALYRRKRYGEVVDLLESVVDLCGCGDDRDRVETLLADALDQRGVQATRDGRTDDAVADFTRAVALAPHQVAARRNLGVTLMNEADKILTDPAHGDDTAALALAQRALDQFEALLRDRPHNGEYRRFRDSGAELKAMILNRRGVAAANRQRFQEALKDLRAAVALAPDVPQVRRNLATTAENAAMAVLVTYSGGLIPPDRKQAACTLLDEAVDQYTTLLAAQPDPELRARLAEVRQLRDLLCPRRNGW